MTRDQSGQSKDYDTDQFEDPVTGYTVHDDGSNFYISPNNGVLYQKIRTINGYYPDGAGGARPSYSITLGPPGLPVTAYVSEDLQNFYVSENGLNTYVPES